MPSQHKSSKKGLSIRVEPDVKQGIRDLAAFNGCDVTEFMIRLSKGLPLKFPDGRSIYSISETKKESK